MKYDEELQETMNYRSDRYNNNYILLPAMINSRIIVDDYIYYRVSKTGYNWISCPTVESATAAPPLKVQQMMRMLGDEFEERYKERFDAMGTQLHITQTTAYSTFLGVVDELFIDGVKWGRVVALFSFGGSLAVQCIEKEMPHLVDNIADWITTYMDNNLNDWLQNHGGWEGFVDFYEKGPEHRNESPWPSLKTICGYAVGAIGVLTVGAILSQKS